MLLKVLEALSAISSLDTIVMLSFFLRSSSEAKLSYSLLKCFSFKFSSSIPVFKYLLIELTKKMFCIISYKSSIKSMDPRLAFDTRCFMCVAAV